MNKLRGLLIIGFCLSWPFIAGAVELCQDVVPGSGTALCMSACGGQYPDPYPAGDNACRIYNVNKPKCCGKTAILPPTPSTPPDTVVTPVEEKKLPNFASLIKTEPEEFIGNIVKGLLGLTGTVTVIMMVYGGLLWMTASGNEKAVGQAKQIILWTAIGLVLVFFSYTILSFLFNSLAG